MKEDLIAPCGMNCSLCISYQFYEKDINKQGFNKKYCPGCIPRGKHCTFLKDKCDLMKNGKLRFCYECDNYPCQALKTIDKRYRDKYHMSMIDNLDFIKEKGINEFLDKEIEKWQCSKCSSNICCHNGLCLSCDVDKLIKNSKYRWNEK